MLWDMRDSLLSLPGSGSSAFVISPLRERTGLLLAGEADYTVSGILRAALATLAADGAQDIHLDLTGLGFMDVCCTRELITMTKRHRAVRIIVYCPPPSMRRITALLYPEAGIEFIDMPGPGAREADGHPGRAASRWPLPAIHEEPPAPDITELIRGEHTRIRKFIAELDNALLDADPAAPESEPAITWAALARFLSCHVDAAREISYRALAEAAPGTATAIAQAAEDDADIRAALEEARLSRPGSPAWHMAVEAACTAAKSHITRLESGPLPHYRHHAAPGARRALGRQWVAFMSARALDASAACGKSRV